MIDDITSLAPLELHRRASENKSLRLFIKQNNTYRTLELARMPDDTQRILAGELAKDMWTSMDFNQRVLMRNGKQIVSIGNCPRIGLHTLSFCDDSVEGAMLSKHFGIEQCPKSHTNLVSYTISPRLYQELFYACLEMGLLMREDK